ncbi:putative serine/threonine-protein kinase pknA2 [Sulfurospirillum sp. 'SP']|nr:serine/threonine-protein kinase [Sulfurospirillum sp. 'SP']WNY99746.1 putative serine/threonine-protein kinase pknA2 [Sulfurospirillum sp. 'SP']
MIEQNCLEAIGLKESKKLKEAGQKVVYQAFSEEFGSVAVKVIRPNLNKDRILREIDIVQKQRDILTSKIFKYDTFICNGIEYLYIIEEFIDGENLRDYLNRLGTVPYDEVCKFLKSMIDTIHILEKNSIVHRDIKPENIMRKTDGQFVLIDFGIARDLSQGSLTPTESPRGPATIIYAPIEQIDNDKDNIDSRVDLYSLSLVAYELLCGKNPFVDGCDTELQVIRKIDKGIFPYLENREYEEMLNFIHTNMNKYKTRRSNSAEEAKAWFDEIHQKLIEGI